MGRFEFLHRLSKKLTDENRIICHEDLSVKNMTGNAKGTAEEPGKHVRAKTGLNREILDKGWYKFRQMLEYKAQWKGGITVPVDAATRVNNVPDADARQKKTAGHKQNLNV